MEGVLSLRSCLCEAVKPMAKSIATKVLLQCLVHAGKVYIDTFTKYFIHEGQ